MCLIAVCDKRRMSNDEIISAFRSNHDGAGFAFFGNDGGIIYKKGIMNVNDLINSYNGIPLPHVVHFRLSTNDRAKELTHPFIISKNAPLALSGHVNCSVLFHNGIITSWKEIATSFFVNNKIKVPNGPWSDTRIAAILTHHMGSNILTFIGGKYAICQPGKKIRIIGSFTKDNGIYFSNSSYKSSHYSQVDYIYRNGTHYGIAGDIYNDVGDDVLIANSKLASGAK